ncbi:hypothetical protein N9C91_00585 [Luminiphilus sp.]|nr:hypothetical protein [Luminiphilus sp.]
MDATPVKNRKLVDRFEEGYVTFYRWLLFVFGAFSIVAVSALVASLVWSTSDTALQESDQFFSAPEWGDLRREILPLRVKMDDKAPPDTSKAERDEPPVDQRVLQIKKNLLASFSGDELEEAQSYFSARLLNEYLLYEVSIPGKWRQQMINDLVSVSLQIGNDDRIARIGSVAGRSEVIMEAVDLFVARYVSEAEAADSLALQIKMEEDGRKVAVTAEVIGAIPIPVGVFLSLIGLVLLIRMELHLRQLALKVSERA